MASEKIALGLDGLVFNERFRGSGRGRRDGRHGNLGGRALGEGVEESGDQLLDGVGMRADEVGEVTAENGIFGLGGSADLRDVATGAGVPAGRKEEEGDHNRAGVETGSAELLGKERVIMRVIATFHRGGDDGAHGVGEEQAHHIGHLVAQRGGGRRRPAVVHNDHRRSGEGADVDRLAHAGGDDLWDDVGIRETRGEREGEWCGSGLQVFQILAERGTDGALRADEKRDEDEVAFAGGELRGHPRDEGPRGGVTVEGGERNPIAVLP